MDNTATENERVRHLLAAYNMAGDRGDLQALASTFATDGVLETPMARFVGRKGIAEGLAQRRRRNSSGPNFVRHHITTSLLEKKGFVWDARSYFIVYTDAGPDHSGIYADRLENADGVWLFAHRSVSIDWVSDQTRFGDLRVLKPNSIDRLQE